MPDMADASDRERPVLTTWLVDRFGLGVVAPRRREPLLVRILDRIAPSMMPVIIRV